MNNAKLSYFDDIFAATEATSESDLARTSSLGAAMGRI